MLPSSLKVIISFWRQLLWVWKKGKKSLVCSGFVWLPFLLSFFLCLGVFSICLDNTCYTFILAKDSAFNFWLHIWPPQHFSSSWMVFLKGIPTPSPWQEECRMGWGDHVKGNSSRCILYLFFLGKIFPGTACSLAVLLQVWFSWVTNEQGTKLCQFLRLEWQPGTHLFLRGQKKLLDTWPAYESSQMNPLISRSWL